MDRGITGFSIGFVVLRPAIGVDVVADPL